MRLERARGEKIKIQVKRKKMAEAVGMPLNKIKPLTDNNYHIWALKVAAILRTKKLFRQIIESEETPVVQDRSGVCTGKSKNIMGR